MTIRCKRNHKLNANQERRIEDVIILKRQLNLEKIKTQILQNDM